MQKKHISYSETRPFIEELFISNDSKFLFFTRILSTKLKFVSFQTFPDQLYIWNQAMMNR